MEHSEIDETVKDCVPLDDTTTVDSIQDELDIDLRTLVDSLSRLLQAGEIYEPLKGELRLVPSE